MNARRVLVILAWAFLLLGPILCGAGQLLEGMTSVTGIAFCVLGTACVIALAARDSK